jgi:hypothetical protein
MEGIFQPTHILVLLVGSVCYTGVVVGVVLVVVSLNSQKQPRQRSVVVA